MSNRPISDYSAASRERMVFLDWQGIDDDEDEQIIEQAEVEDEFGHGE